MGNRINIHLHPNFDKKLVPIRAERWRDWWEDNQATRDHAKHCLPLTMANSLGYYILSPGTFLVRWDGDVHNRATIELIEKSSHCEIDDHAAFGSFTVQSKFVPVTDDPGDYVYIKGIPNERGLPYTCMEGLIEAWWSVGYFGIVCLINQPGEFIIQMGTPIAQMCLYKGLGGVAELELVDGYPAKTKEWDKKRSRPDYKKDFDYMRGLLPDGEKTPTHITNWRDAGKFK